MKDHESFFQGFSYLLLSIYGKGKYKEDNLDYFCYSCVELLKTFHSMGLIKTYTYQRAEKGTPYWFMISLYFSKDPTPYYLVYYKDNRVLIEYALPNHEGLEVIHIYELPRAVIPKKVSMFRQIRVTGK